MTGNQKVFMSLQAISQQNLLIPPDHRELFFKGISILTIDPYVNLFSYLFPSLGTCSSQKLQTDLSLEPMMPFVETEPMLEEIKALATHTGIKREISTYITLNQTLSSNGGRYSIGTPNLSIPVHYLFRPNQQGNFLNGAHGDWFRDSSWVFSDDETRFLIARELAKIQTSSLFLKIAIKVAIIAALVISFTDGIALGAALYIGILGVQLLLKRDSETKADIKAVETLRERKVVNPTSPALSALEKMGRQNLARRENSLLSRLYITQSGNNVLDFIHPFLTTRMEKLEAWGSR